MSSQLTQLSNRLYHRIMALEEENKMLKEALASERERELLCNVIVVLVKRIMKIY